VTDNPYLYAARILDRYDGDYALARTYAYASGPAYGLLLDAWGEDFLAHGALEVTFVGMVTDEQTVEATVDGLDATEASIRVENLTAGTTAVVGTARREAAG
jgi:hypothetical protein